MFPEQNKKISFKVDLNPFKTVKLVSVKLFECAQVRSPDPSGSVSHEIYLSAEPQNYVTAV